MTHNTISHHSVLVGRLLIALLFVGSGVSMLLNFNQTASFFASMGLPMATLMLIAVLIIKLCAGTAFALGVHTREAAWALILFTAAATVVAHLGEGQMVQALKNLAIIGGLLVFTSRNCNGGKSLVACPCPKCKKASQGGVCTPNLATGNCNNCGTCSACKGKEDAATGTEEKEEERTTQ